MFQENFLQILISKLNHTDFLKDRFNPGRLKHIITTEVSEVAQLLRVFNRF